MFPQIASPKDADDAEHAEFYPLDEILKKDKIAFDHLDIIKRYIELFP
jgi:ADP-ribose pyrophosphatase YjhB (NUDIX family)